MYIKRKSVLFVGVLFPVINSRLFICTFERISRKSNLVFVKGSVWINGSIELNMKGLLFTRSLSLKVVNHKKSNFKFCPFTIQLLLPPAKNGSISGYAISEGNIYNCFAMVL